MNVSSAIVTIQYCYSPANVNVSISILAAETNTHPLPAGNLGISPWAGISSSLVTLIPFQASYDVSISTLTDQLPAASPSCWYQC